MKRALSLVLAFVMILTVFSANALADDNRENVDWSVMEDSLLDDTAVSEVSGGEDLESLPSDKPEIEEESQEENPEPEDPFQPIWPCDSWKITTYGFYWYGGNVTRHAARSNRSAADGHLNALDIAGKGTRIFAVESGIVEEAGNSGEGLGYLVVIRHENGLRSLYAHLKAGSLTVKVGDHVERGRQIATMGNSGGDYGVHLHFELYGIDEKDNYTLVNPFRKYYESKYRSVLHITRESILAAEKVLTRGRAADKTGTRYVLTAETRENMQWYLDTVRDFYTYDEEEKWYEQKTETALPSVTAVTPTRPSARAGETVTFNIGVKGGMMYYLRIRRSGASAVYFSSDKTVFTYSFAKPGTYTIEVDAWNSAGTVHLPAIQYTVTDPVSDKTE